MVNADTFQVLQDYNYEVEDSDSFTHTLRGVNSISMNEKIYFEVEVPSDMWFGIKGRRLAVTDGTENGTHLVKGLEDKNLEGTFRAFYTVNNKLVILLSGESSHEFEIWEVAQETNQAVKVATFLYPNDFNYGVIAHYYTQNKLVLTSPQSRDLIIYDSETSSIEELDLPVIADSYSHNVSYESFILGDYFYYEPSISNAENPVYRLNLRTKTVEQVHVQGIGSSHFIYNGSVYYVNKDVDNLFYIYSLDPDSGDIKKEFGPVTKFNSKPSHSFKVIDNKLIYNNLTSFIIRNDSADSFYAIDFPESSAIDYKDLSTNLVMFNGEYYFIGYEYTHIRTGEKHLLKTDLYSSIEKVYEYKELNLPQSDYGSGLRLIEDNGNLFTVVMAKAGNQFVVGKTMVYEWEDIYSNFTLSWEQQNLGIYAPIHDSRKDIVFAYTIETGAEPWKINAQLGNAFQLADFNEDNRTQGNSIVSKFSSVTRVVISYFPFYDMQNYNLFSLKDDFFTGYIPPDRHNYEQVGIDEIYDYYHLTDISSVYIKLYDTLSNEIVDMGTVDKAVYKNFDYLNLHDGVLTYLSDGVVRQKGIDGIWEFEIGAVYKKLVRGDGASLAYGWDEERETIEFLVFDRVGVSNTFSIPCVDDSASCTEPYVYFKEDTVLVSHTRTSSSFDTYYEKNFIVKLNQSPSVYELGLELLGGNGLPENGPLALTNEALLIGAEEIVDKRSQTKFIKVSLDDYATKSVTINIADGNLVHAKDARTWLVNAGDYRLGLLSDNTDSTYVLVFNKKLDIVNYKNLGEEPLNVQEEGIKLSKPLECIYGYCYVRGYYWRKQGDEPTKYFTYKFDVTLENIEQEFSYVDPQEYILKNIDTAYLIGYSTQYGKELYKQEVEGVDSDGDGIWDAYELAYDMDPTSAHDGALDIDGDGLSNYEEFKLGTSILKDDTDDDGLNDGVEIDLGFDPRSYDLHLRDSDGDGLSYRAEKDIGTDPHNSDTDGDGFIDSEDAFPLEPSENADFDSDGIGDNADPDDDNDEMPDEWEEQYGLNPFDPLDRNTDLDNDGISNYQEYINGTDPRVGNNNSGGGDSNPPSSDSGGGGSVPMWLLLMLVAYVSLRKYRS